MANKESERRADEQNTEKTRKRWNFKLCWDVPVSWRHDFRNWVISNCKKFTKHLHQKNSTHFETGLETDWFCLLWTWLLTYPSVADFFFTFSLFWPPAAPTTGSVCECSSDPISGMWTHNLTCSNQSWWPVLPLQVLFSHFHLLPTAGPTVQPQVRSFISVLWPPLLVLNQFILSAQTKGIDLSFYCRFHFWYFAFLTTCSQQWLVGFTSIF